MKRLNLVGQRFGKLIVLEQAPSRTKSSFWLCQCDCGNRAVVRGGNLTSGRTHSCGCEIPRNRLKVGEAARNVAFMALANSAGRKGLPWTITKERFAELIQGKCLFCGAPPQKVFTVAGCKGSLTCNGIGFIEKKLGYVDGNVISCCFTCLPMRGSLSFEKFLYQIGKIATRIPSIQGKRGHGVKQL